MRIAVVHILRLAKLAFSWSQLLIAITFALPSLGVRILYSLISQFDKGINAYTGPLVYRVVLAALMEFIIITILAVFGLVTRGIRLKEPNLAKSGSREIEAGTVWEASSRDNLWFDNLKWAGWIVLWSETNRSGWRMNFVSVAAEKVDCWGRGYHVGNIYFWRVTFLLFGNRITAVQWFELTDPLGV